jgi:hypothetical protein
MCDHLYYEVPRRHRTKRMTEPEPELEKVEEKPIIVKS